jgi:competence protein ComEC
MKRLLAALIALMLMLTAAACAAADAPATTERGFELHVINVGKADCLLIKSDGLWMMVDTGDAEDEQVIRDYMNSLGVTKLEYLVATHPDKDHIGGMPWVLTECNVAEAWICPLPEDSKPYMRMTAALSAEGTPTAHPKAGDTAALGGASIEVLSPTDALLATGDENECSIVLMISYGSSRFLLMGDAQEMAEQWLLASGYDLSADVIKVGHHGSNQSSSEEFIAAVQPNQAAISCGYSDEDNYPDSDTLDILSGAGAQILRTDADGTIVFRSDGETISCETLGTDVAAAGYVLDSKSDVFHLTTCSELPKRKRRVFYARRDDAVAAGGTPCEVCNP